MYFLLSIILLPLIGALLIPIKKQNRQLYYFATVLIAIIQLIIIIYTPLNTYVKWSVIEFMCDKYSWIFLITINISWILSIIYSYDFNKYNFQGKTKKFFLFLHLTLSAVFANALAENLFTLFIFYIAGIPITYPLLLLRNDVETKKAAKTYLLQTLIPPFIFVLPALYITYQYIDTISFSTSTTFGEIALNPYVGSLLLFLFLFGFSQNSIIPFHSWLPALKKAPAPVSALIHSVAAVKAAPIAIIKLSVYIFGLDYINILTGSLFTGGVLIHLCGITAIITAWKAYKTTNLKERFSYSTVGQLMYILIGILIGTPAALLGATLHILSHSIAKSGLFYAAGYFNSIHGSVNTKRITEIAPHLKWIVVFIAICGLSITGFPFLAGYYSKDTMLLEEIHLGNYTSAAYLLIGSVINFFYILPIIKSGFKKSNKNNIQNTETPVAMTMVFTIIAIIILTFSLIVPSITKFLLSI
jgi:multicomponent Na+:H+ antiporter subunit D